MRFQKFIKEGAREIRELQVEIRYNVEKLKLLKSDPEHQQFEVEELQDIVDDLKTQLQSMMGTSED